VTPKRILAQDVAWGATGLVPAVVQDVSDGRVLMVAYVDAEAMAATMKSGQVHFHSRSRGQLWRKGETSGNVLRLRDISVDCDGDALLLSVDPVGPTCHRGTRSCFDATPADPAVPAAPNASASRKAVAVTTAERSSGPADGLQGFGWLETLWATIDARATAEPTSSYTARLVADGVDGPARKVAEEATEVLMAAKDDAVATAEARPATRDALTGEVADLLYHVLVVLRERGLAPADVIARLRERHKP
jgi:phosphoribosyl-AMP cyclohydrolase / phosphoribosyl-ATP pyrophosphohydrolase